MKEQEFISGFYPKQKHEKAPDFVISTGSIKVEDMLMFLAEKQKSGNEWVNFQVLKSKDGSKLYAVVDNWEKEKPVKEALKDLPVKDSDPVRTELNEKYSEEISVDEIPF